eukprot:766918-Hanusia_phi.AAC.2
MTPRNGSVASSEAAWPHGPGDRVTGRGRDRDFESRRQFESSLRLDVTASITTGRSELQGPVRMMHCLARPGPGLRQGREAPDRARAGPGRLEPTVN